MINLTTPRLVQWYRPLDLEYRRIAQLPLIMGKHYDNKGLYDIHPHDRSVTFYPHPPEPVVDLITKLESEDYR